MSTPVLKIILARRSVREFLDKEVEDEKIYEILNAGRWAPSGLNNQGWRFIVVKEKKLLNDLARLTAYGSIIVNAPLCIAVFLDTKVVYDRIKDVQSVGACIENMLLAAQSMTLGTVWLGEILKNKDAARVLLEAPENFELMAVVAIGYPEDRERKSTRHPLAQIAWLNKYGNQLGFKSK